MIERGAVSLLGVRFGGASDGVSLSLRPGERVALVGPNGAGKTSLLRLVAGLAEPTSGVVRAGGPIAYLPQACAASLLPWWRARANVALPLAERRSPASRRRVGDVARRLGLDESVLDRFPRALSGGQQQRVALARALVDERPILLLDEPFSAIDAHARDAIRAAVDALVAERGATMLLVTHDVDDLTLVERIVSVEGRPMRVREATSQGVATDQLAVLGAMGRA